MFFCRKYGFIRALVFPLHFFTALSSNRVFMHSTPRSSHALQVCNVPNPSTYHHICPSLLYYPTIIRFSLFLLLSLNVFRLCLAPQSSSWNDSQRADGEKKAPGAYQYAGPCAVISSIHRVSFLWLNAGPLLNHAVSRLEKSLQQPSTRSILCVL